MSRSVCDVMKILIQHGPQTTDVKLLERTVLTWNGNDMIQFFKGLGDAALTSVKQNFLFAFKAMHRMLSATADAARNLAVLVWKYLNICAYAIKGAVDESKKFLDNVWEFFMAGLADGAYYLQVGIKAAVVTAATQGIAKVVDWLLPKQQRSWVGTWTVLGGGAGAVAGTLFFPWGLLFGAAACAGGAATGSYAGFAYGMMRTISLLADFIDDGGDIPEPHAMKRRRLI